MTQTQTRKTTRAPRRPQTQQTQQQPEFRAVGVRPEPAESGLAAWQKKYGAFNTSFSGSVEDVSKYRSDRTKNTILTLVVENEIHAAMETAISFVHEEFPEAMVMINAEGEPAQIGEEYTINPDCILSRDEDGNMTAE